jgi:hypothetical protein
MPDLNEPERGKPVFLTDDVNGTRIGTVGDALKTASSSASIVDDNNSSATPLGIAGVFTGAATDVTSYSTISIYIATDQDSAVGGLRFEFSSDGTNWDQGDNYTEITTRPLRYLTVGCIAKYFRVVYTNGGTAQGYFRLQTILHSQSIKPSSHRLGDLVNDDNDAELSKAVITAKDANTGLYGNVDRLGDRLKVDAAFSTLPEAGITKSGRRFITTTGTRVKVGASESAEILIFNPPDSGVDLIFDRQIFISVDQGVNLIFAIYHNPTISTAACTFTDAGNTVNVIGHGFVDGDKARFATIVTTTGILVETTYWIVNANVDDFQVSLTEGGAPIDLVNDGSGTYYLLGEHIKPHNALIQETELDSSVEVFYEATVTNTPSEKIAVYQARDNMVFDETIGRVILEQGENLSITLISSGNNKQWAYNVAWEEEPTIVP